MGFEQTRSVRLDQTLRKSASEAELRQARQSMPSSSASEAVLGSGQRPAVQPHNLRKTDVSGWSARLSVRAFSALQSPRFRKPVASLHCF